MLSGKISARLRGEGTVHLHTMLEDAAAISPDKVAIIQGRRRVTYGWLRGAAAGVGRFLSDGHFRKGERAVILLENSPEYVAALFGISVGAGIAVPLGNQVTARNLKKVFSDCSPSVVFVQKGTLSIVDEVLPVFPCVKVVIVVEQLRGVAEESGTTKAGDGERERICFCDIIKDGAEGPWRQKVVGSGPDNIAMILYTSGTTGEPKGVMLTHQNLLSNADSIVRYLHLTADDRVMVILPFCYAYGNSLLTTHMRVGGSLVLENSFFYPNVVLDRMRDEEVTGFSGVPSSFALLLNRSNVRSHTFHRLRYLTQAGGAMSPNLILELRGIFPDKDIYIMYGQTEATARLSYLEPADLERKPGSIGKAIHGVSLTLSHDGTDVDGYSGERRMGRVGEIVAKGDNIMAGYWNNLVETAKVIKPDGLHTGDLARVDDEGYFYIVGRRSEIIKSGAYRISPKEIEEVILESPGIHEAAVVGTPDDILGEMVVAYIVAKPGCTLDAKEILTHCWKQLPPFKVPRRVVFVESLPKNQSGKVRKHDLAAICLRGSK